MLFNLMVYNVIIGILKTFFFLNKLFVEGN